MKHELCEIEAMAGSFAIRRKALADIVDTIKCQIERVYREHRAALKKAVVNAAEHQAALESMVAAAPELFQKPRTVVFHGIKVGYRKGKGGLDWDDDDQVVKLIKKHFPEMADVLIRKKETPNKLGLEELAAADLKRLGVMVEDTGDVVTVKPVDGGVDKIVKALLKNATEEIREEAA